MVHSVVGTSELHSVESVDRSGKAAKLEKQRGARSPEAWGGFWRTIKRRKLVIAGVFTLSVLVAVVVSYQLTPIYRATARILVENNMSELVGIKSALPQEGPLGIYYGTQLKLIGARPVLLAVAERLHLAQRAGFKGVADIPAKLKGMLRVTLIKGTKIIDVSVEGPSREEVHELANAVVMAFREETLRRRESSSGFATGWLRNQLPRLRDDVLAAEEALQEFQVRHNVVSLDRRHDIVSQRLAQLNEAVTAADRECIGINSEFTLIQQARDDPTKIAALPVIVRNGAIRELDRMLLALEARKIEVLKDMIAGHPVVQILDQRIIQLQAKQQQLIDSVLAAVKNRLVSARAKQRALKAVLAEQQKKALKLNELLIALNAVQRKVDHARQLYEPMLRRLGKLDLASGFNIDPVMTVEEAQEARSPIKPRKTLIVAAGAFLGLLLALRLAFLLDRSDPRLRSVEDVKQLVGLEALGAIPHMKAKDEKKRYMACHFDPRSEAAEAYRALRTSILFSTNGEKSSVLLVTSPIKEEGKTTTATNIAAAMAKSQKSVLLIDADLRRSALHRLFNLSKDRGLTAYLADGQQVGDTVHKTELPGLSVVTAGATPDNPAELLDVPRMKEFLDWARENYDVIVIDSPPLGLVTDASVLAALADYALIVVRPGRTPTQLAIHTREILEQAEVKLIGAVLNDIRRGSDTYGYSYYYYPRKYY